MEAEFSALNIISSEAKWLKDLISEFSKPVPPISIHTDSRSTIELLMQNNVNKKLNRFIHIRLKSFRCLGKIIILDFVKSEKLIH